jgi:hypothetical protein
MQQRINPSPHGTWPVAQFEVQQYRFALVGFAAGETL